MKKNKGFTLIEVMIVVAVIGILAAIAYPSYSEFIRKGKRADAKQALLAAAEAVERFKASNFTYDGSGAAFNGKVNGGGSKVYYTITLSNASATTYTLTATAEGSMAGDGNFSINESGTRLYKGGPWK